MAIIDVAPIAYLPYAPRLRGPESNVTRQGEGVITRRSVTYREESGWRSGRNLAICTAVCGTFARRFAGVVTQRDGREGKALRLDSECSENERTACDSPRPRGCLYSRHAIPSGCVLVVYMCDLAYINTGRLGIHL